MPLLPCLLLLMACCCGGWGGLVTATSWGADCLASHNAGRRSEGLPPLAWDMRLSADAQSWANSLAARNAFEHSKMPHGENLYEQRGLSSECARAVKAWTDEKPLYRDEVIPGGNFEGYGHYTQVMWGPTTRIGCAFATKKDGTIVTVCEYSPPGNVVGKRLSEVNAPVRAGAASRPSSPGVLSSVNIKMARGREAAPMAAAPGRRPNNAPAPHRGQTRPPPGRVASHAGAVAHRYAGQAHPRGRPGHPQQPSAGTTFVHQGRRYVWTYPNGQGHTSVTQSRQPQGSVRQTVNRQVRYYYYYHPSASADSRAGQRERGPPAPQ